MTIAFHGMTCPVCGRHHPVNVKHAMGTQAYYCYSAESWWVGSLQDPNSTFLIEDDFFELAEWFPIGYRTNGADQFYNDLIYSFQLPERRRLRDWIKKTILTILKGRK